MRDLNSVLIEGTVQKIRPKRSHSGIWIELKSRRDRETEDEAASHRFRIEVRENLRGCPPDAFTIGRRIRVVGTLRRLERLGAFVQAEHVEFKNAPPVMV